MPAVLLFIAGIAATVAWGVDEGVGWLVLLLTASAVSASVMWKRIRWADDWGRYLSFGALILLACVANRALYIADLLIAEDSRLAWPFYSNSPEWSVLKAEVVTMTGTLLTLFAWVVAGGARFSPGSAMLVSAGPLRRLLVTTYVVSLMGLIVSLVAPTFSQLAGQLLPTLISLGATTAFFIPLLVSSQRSVRLLLVMLMGVPFLYVALGTGMKENILLTLAPTAYYVWNFSKRKEARAGVVLVALLTVGLITSYIQFFRGEAWHAEREMDQAQAVSEFIQTVDDQGMAATFRDGTKEFLARNNAAPYRGWAVAIADSDGHMPGLVFAPMVYVFVPRVLWPEKPEVRQGWEYAGVVFGEQYISWSGSSLSAGLYPALYLGRGWLAVVLGALGVGGMMALVTRLAMRLGGPALAGLFSMSMLPYAMRLDEAWTVGAFSAPLISLAYIYAIFLGMRLATGRVGTRAAGSDHGR